MYEFLVGFIMFTGFFSFIGFFITLFFAKPLGLDKQYPNFYAKLGDSYDNATVSSSSDSSNTSIIGGSTSFCDYSSNVNNTVSTPNLLSDTQYIGIQGNVYTHNNL